jgi:hypothetical protein
MPTAEDGDGVFYFEKVNDVSYNIMVGVTHKVFVDDIQTEFQTTDKSIAVDVRLVVRNGDNEILSALTS